MRTDRSKALEGMSLKNTRTKRESSGVSTGEQMGSVSRMIQLWRSRGEIAFIHRWVSLQTVVIGSVLALRNEFNQGNCRYAIVARTSTRIAS